MASLSDNDKYNNTILKVVDAIKNADYILVGGASGMSAAGGPDWYKDNDRTYLKNFQDIQNKYKAGSIWKNLYLEEYTHQHWQSREDWWGFLITLMHFVSHEEVYQPYKDLKDILEGKEYDIITTNQDGQFVNAFPEKNVAIIQGDWTYFQCSKRCHDEVYPGKELIDELFTHVCNGQLPKELIPRCDKCGAEKKAWVRDYGFLEGEFYKYQYEKYRRFFDYAKGKRKAVYLELGVGDMTPEFIKNPFMKFTHDNRHSIYITINPKTSLILEEVKKIRRKCRIIFTETIHVKKNASFYVTKFLPILPFDVSLNFFICINILIILISIFLLFFLSISSLKKLRHNIFGKI